VPVEDYLLLMKTIPLRKRGIVREHKLFKVYLPIDMNDLWEELHKRRTEFDVIVLIPQVNDTDKPDLLKLVDKIIMKNRVITREHNRFKIYLSSTYNDVWEYLNKRDVKVDLVLILRK